MKLNELKYYRWSVQIISILGSLLAMVLIIPALSFFDMSLDHTFSTIEITLTGLSTGGLAILGFYLFSYLAPYLLVLFKLIDKKQLPYLSIDI